ncbi:putative sesquiterpene synthase, partial [Mucuna pruriens]
MKKLKFIDCIQRFGISYHFQKEINQALEQIHNTIIKNNTIISEDDSHHFLALLFYLLRQQGYQISSNVFNKFKNDQGNFNETLANDIQGLCSLYEATHLRTHEDDILEEACDFSNTRLMSLSNQMSPSLSAQIKHCLRQPLNKSVLKLEAKYHMTIYEQDHFHNETLLTFAKLDFNILQKMYQKEIGIITKWWKKSNLMKKVPYARDRLVESYIWSLAFSHKPEYSKGRMLMILTMLMALSKNLNSSHKQFKELCGEIELETNKSGKSNFVVPRFKQAIFKLVKGYMVETKWCQEGFIPTYDEYKVNGILTSIFTPLMGSFIGLGEFVTKDVFDWIFSNPTIIEAVSIIGRVLNDISSHKFEQERAHVASADECCMKQYCVSQAEEAYNLLRKDDEDYWKVINEECIK